MLWDRKILRGELGLSYGKRSIEQYRKTAVSTATPLQLVIMMYDGALRFMQGAKVAMEAGDRFDKNEKLLKAERIVVELSVCLDMEAGKEIAQNLFTLYDFVHQRLVDANLEDRPDYIDQAMKVMSDLRESWVVLNAQTTGQGEADAA